MERTDGSRIGVKIPQMRPTIGEQAQVDQAHAYARDVLGAHGLEVVETLSPALPPTS